MARGEPSSPLICCGGPPPRHRSPSMNRYATMAERHWRRWLPSRVAAMEDPSSFFSSLGEEVAEEIEDLTMELAGADPPGESYLDKAGRLNMDWLRTGTIMMLQRRLLPPA